MKKSSETVLGCRGKDRAFSRPVMLLGLAVFFSFTVYVDNRWISTIPHPTSPYFGATMSLLAFFGAAVFLALIGCCAGVVSPSGRLREVHPPTLRQFECRLFAIPGGSC